MEEKDLLKVMLTGFWLKIQTGSSLAGLQLGPEAGMESEAKSLEPFD